MPAVSLPGVQYDVGRLRPRIGTKFVVVFTRGLAQSSGAAGVELLTEIDAYDARVVDVLAHLAAQAASGQLALAPYEAVALPDAIHGHQYFDVRPGGSLSIPPTGRVKILKVLPIEKRTFEEVQRQDRASQWIDDDAVDPDRAQRARSRWSQW